MKSVIIGTAGHIDHGKTALVKALTGVDTDRLPEEKARGITIDIGFAHTQFGDIKASFIDVPGHERFIKNMLAGIGGIDLLLLVIAADESVMPQTREHFEICRLLNIQHGVVAITKKDLVDAETLMLVREDIADFLARSFLQNAPVVEVSAKTAEGIDLLRNTLQTLSEQARPRSASGVARLPIDRVFTLKGHGTIVTGTLISGCLRKDDAAEILPSGIKARVRSIHAHDQNVAKACAGQRTAVNLQGIEKEQIVRGDVLTEPHFFSTTSLLDTKIQLLQSSRPLRHNSIVRFHHLTNDVFARVTLIGLDVLQPGSSCFAQLRLQQPVFAIYGDRFILRKHSPLLTIGGGIILDHMPRRRSRGETAHADALQVLEKASTQERLAIAVHEKRSAGATEEFLKAKLALHLADIMSMTHPDVLTLQAQPVLMISKTTEGQLRARMLATAQQFHQTQPLLPGIPKEELRTKYMPHVSPDVFAAVLNRAVEARQLQIQKDLVALFGRSISLSNTQEELAAGVQRCLIDAGLEFPGMETIAKTLRTDAGSLKNILHLLARQSQVMKVGDDYFVHRKTWDDVKNKIRDLKASQKTFSVVDFKNLFGVTRKYAIPLLEQLDREGVTRRSGNERIIL